MNERVYWLQYRDEPGALIRVVCAGVLPGDTRAEDRIMLETVRQPKRRAFVEWRREFGKTWRTFNRRPIQKEMEKPWEA